MAPQATGAPGNSVLIPRDNYHGTRLELPMTVSRSHHHHPPARPKPVHSHAKPVHSHAKPVQSLAKKGHTHAAKAVGSSSVGGSANGRIPLSKLTSIGGGHRLMGPAAAAYMKMRQAAAGAGIRWGITDSYRPYAVQVSLAQRKGLYKNGGLAAVPGTSPHGWGRAVDLDLSRASTNWLRQNAARFGFRTIPREPWHWEFRG